METFFMNSKNSKTNKSHKFKYDLIDRLDLRNPNKNMALANLSTNYTWKNVKSVYDNNKFKISAPTWNETFEKHETIGENASILIYANTINNRIAF